MTTVDGDLADGERRRRLPVAARVTALTTSLAAIVATIVGVFGPGVMTLDGLSICDQAFGSTPINDWHTPVLTWIWSVTRVPVPLVFTAQTCLIVGSAYVILRTWLRDWAAVAWTAVVVWFPASVGWVSVVGKDEWFASSMLAAVAMLGASRRAAVRRSARVALGAALVMLWVAAAARPSAILIVAATLLAGWPTPVRGWRSRPSWIGRVAVVAVCAGAVFLSQSLLDSVVIHSVETHPEQVTLQNDLVGMSLRVGRVLLPQTSLRRGATLQDLDDFFDYQAPTSIYWDADSPLVMGSEHFGELRSAWLKAIREHPVDYVGHSARMAAAVLGITGPHPLGTAVDGGGRGENFGLVCPLAQPYWQSARDEAQSILIRLERLNVWRAWFWLLLLVTAGMIAGLRRGDGARALVVAGSASMLLYTTAAGSITFRYAWFTVLCALVVCGLALGRWGPLRRPRPDEAVTVAEDDEDESSSIRPDEPFLP